MKHTIKGIVQHFGKFAHSFSFWEWDEKIDVNLVSESYQLINKLPKMLNYSFKIRERERLDLDLRLVMATIIIIIITQDGHTVLKITMLL